MQKTEETNEEVYALRDGSRSLSNAGISLVISKFNVFLFCFVFKAHWKQIYIFQDTGIIIDLKIPLWFEGVFNTS